jgi:hypothetical protein
MNDILGTAEALRKQNVAIKINLLASVPRRLFFAALQRMAITLSPK